MAFYVALQEKKGPYRDRFAWNKSVPIVDCIDASFVMTPDAVKEHEEREKESIAALWRRQSEYLLYSFISQSGTETSQGTQDKNQVLGNSIDLAS